MSIRKIAYGEFDSLQAGIRINSERSSTSGGEQNVSADTIAYRDGDIRYPTGRTAARLTYCFILREGSREANEAKARAVIEQISGRRGDLTDSDSPGRVYKNAVYETAEPLEYVNRNFATAYMVVSFTADPVPERAGAVNDRLVGFAVRGACSITIGSWVQEGVTLYHIMVNDADYQNILTVDTVMDAPFVFRLEAISENAAAASILGEGDIEIGVPFAHEPSFYMQITHTGYGWYELWHDTREVIP